VRQVISAVKKYGDRVDVVGIGLSDAQVSPLSRIADAGHGTLVNPADTNALSELFAGEARSLASQVLISFPVPAAYANTSANLQVSIRAGHSTYTDEAFVRMGALPKPTAPPIRPIPVTSPKAAESTSTSALVLVAGIVAIAIALFAGSAVLLHMLFNGDSGPTPEKLLEIYTVLAGSEPEANPVNMREAAVDFTSKVIRHRGFEERLTTKLQGAGLAVRPAEWMLIDSGTALGAGFVGYLLFHGNLVLAILLAAIGAGAPWMFLRFRQSSRVKAFNSQLADGLQLMSGGLKAGLSMAQSIDSIVREGNEPMAGEFRRALLESQLGVGIEDALEKVAARMKSDDFKWVVMAIRIQHQVGGNLAELLLTVAATIREREYLRRQVRALSAEGRMSAYVLCGMPPLFLLYLSLTNPGQVHVLFHTGIGIVLCCLAGLMMSVGVFWMSRVVKVEV
jgi:tight adherence protein B